MLIGPAVFRRLCRARELLREVHDEAVTIAAIAREVDISRYHFIRQFEAVFGRTPHQYRIHARLDRARHLLAAGGRSVTEVCMEVGFSSLGSFSALFTRTSGMAPSAFQRRMRTLVQVPGRVPMVMIPGCFSLMASLPPRALRNFREA